jgi:integrase
VPLSESALQVLQSVRPDHPERSDLVFAVGGAARSNMAMTMLLRRMGHGDVTVHGFRSSFRDWAGDSTHFPREIVEQALAHTIGDEAERAYRRGTAIERRRTLMDAWAGYLGGIASNVVPFPNMEAAA